MKRMKQVLALLLSLALLLGMASVAEEASEPVAAEAVEELVEELVAEPAEEPAPEPEEAPEEPEIVAPEAEEPVEESVEEPVEEPIEELVEEPEAEPAEEEEISIEAEEFDADSDFVIEDGVLTDYTGSDADVVVPNTVQKIVSGAFAGSKTLVSVHLPESLTTIGQRAFSDCISLASIKIPGSVTSIESLAFDGCYNLKSIVFADGEADLSINGTIMFGTPIIIPDSETPPMRLESITVGRNIINTGKNDGWWTVFWALNNLSSVKFTDGVTRIPDHFIDQCSNLQTLSIPESMVSIGDSAMKSCDFREVRLPTGLTSIGEGAFVGSNNMMAIVDKGSYAEQYCKDNKIKYKYPGSGDTPVGGASVSLSLAEVTLTQKESVTLKASTEGLSKKESYTFSSSDTNVASVSKTGGKISAKNPGTATITATGKTSKQSASCTVTVIPAPTTVRIAKPAKLDYTTDDEPFALAASVEPADAAQSVKWTSSDETVARVSAEGQVTLVGQGKATITAKSEKKGTNGKQRSNSFVLQVTDPHMPASVKIAEKAAGPVYVDKDKTLTLSYELAPVTQGQEAASAVTWSIPKAKERKIATINFATGEITPLKEGSATVKITTQKKGGTGKKLKQLSDTVKITVVDPLKPREVKIDQGSAAPLYAGAESLQLSCKIIPETATPGVSWSIPAKQQKIATIDASTGLLKPGSKTGTVTVTVKTTAKKSNNKPASATIKVTVGADPSLPFSVKITGEDGTELQDGVELKVGQTLKLSACIEPETATQKTEQSWSIAKSQKKYATVDADGTVHGVKAGKTVTVTVKTANGKKASIKIKIVQ